MTGNGEEYHNAATGTLDIEVVAGDWPAPDKIEVRGGWFEDWTRVEATTYAPLPPPTTCGPYFDEYQLDTPPDRPGSGLRCFLGNTGNRTTWYGNGEWGGTRYTHIGTLGVSGHGEARDLCGPAFGAFCGMTPPQSLHFSTATPRRFGVTGAWNEQWR